MLVGLLVFVGVAAWQVKTITGSRYPAVRAVEALGLIFPLYLLIFASTYFVMQRVSAASFTEPLTRTDALYFSVTVFSTVGFGDIAPKSEVARVVLIVQMLGDLAILEPASGSCWGPCAAASNGNRIRATAPARPSDEEPPPAAAAARGTAAPSSREGRSPPESSQKRCSRPRFRRTRCSRESCSREPCSRERVPRGVSTGGRWRWRSWSPPACT